MEQERLEQEQRERRYREREEQIEEHRHGRGRSGGLRDAGRSQAQGGCARATSGWVGAWALVPTEGGVGQGWWAAAGRSRCPAPLPCSRCRRKQQSMEAEEARQRLKEQSIFVSAVAGRSQGGRLASPPGKGFSQLGPQSVTGGDAPSLARESSRRRMTGSSSENRSQRWR